VNHRRIVIFLLPLFLLNCGYYYSLFRKNSTYYSENERDLLKKTTAICGQGYGYDPDVDLDYVFVNNFTKGPAADRDAALQKVFRNIGQKDAVGFFEKIYALREATVYVMNGYEKKGKWTEQTYLKKYLLPPLEEYCGLLEKNLMALYADYGASIDSRKKEIRLRVQDDMIRKEEEREKMYDYST
jgi:hypothetical protein